MPEKTLRFSPPRPVSGATVCQNLQQTLRFQSAHAQVNFGEVVKGDGFLNRITASGPVTGAVVAFTSSLDASPVLQPASCRYGYTVL